MDVVHGWENVPSRFRGASIAIGNFDGVHRGHQAVLSAAKAGAASLKVAAGVMVFEPYPRKYFQPDKSFFSLTPLPQKLQLLGAGGCEFAAVIPFNSEMAQLSANDFARQILHEGYMIRHAAVGFNFLFGKARGGNAHSLVELGQVYGFEVTVVEPKGDEGEIFSSTRIRELLAEGDVAAAAEMFGRFWRVNGIVEGGAGRGQGLGFPTANIRLQEGIALKHGIYAVRVYIDDCVFHGASYLGTRPTFDSGFPLLETFLFNFNGDLYGKIIEIEFIAFVREDAKFRSAEKLAAQMATDIAKAQAILDKLEKNGAIR